MVFPGYDFFHLWAAGRSILDGRNPYVAANLALEMAAAGWPTDQGDLGFLHPPWTIWLFALFGLLDFSTARALWLMTIVGTVLGCALLGCRQVQPLHDRATDYGDYMFASLLFPPFLSTLAYGQSNHLMLLGVVGAVSLLNRNRSSLSGFIFSLGMTKPQVLWGVAVLLLIRAKRDQKARLCAGMSAGLALQLVVSFALFPSAFSSFIEAMKIKGAALQGLPGATLAQVINVLTGIRLNTFLFVANIPLVFLIVFSRLSFDRAWGVVACTSCLASPYAWSHSFLFILPNYASSLVTTTQYRPRLLRVVVTGLAMLGVLDILRPLVFAPFMIVIPVFVLAMQLKKGPGEDPLLPCNETDPRSY
jgi:hypothetical protein